MKVYVITKGCYSDYHICAVAISKERAEELAAIYSDRYDNAEIEEYDSDAYNEFRPGINAYRLVISEDFKISRVWEASIEYMNVDDFEIKKITNCGSYVIDCRYDSYTFSVLAKDEDAAKKIAVDRFAKFMAEKAGL